MDWIDIEKQKPVEGTESEFRVYLTPVREGLSPRIVAASHYWEGKFWDVEYCNVADDLYGENMVGQELLVRTDRHEKDIIGRDTYKLTHWMEIKIPKHP